MCLQEQPSELDLSSSCDFRGDSSDNESAGGSKESHIIGGRSVISELENTTESFGRAQIYIFFVRTNTQINNY